MNKNEILKNFFSKEEEEQKKSRELQKNLKMLLEGVKDPSIKRLVDIDLQSILTRLEDENSGIETYPEWLKVENYKYNAWRRYQNVFAVDDENKGIVITEYRGHNSSPWYPVYCWKKIFFIKERYDDDKILIHYVDNTKFNNDIFDRPREIENVIIKDAEKSKLIKSMNLPIIYLDSEDGRGDYKKLIEKKNDIFGLL